MRAPLRLLALQSLLGGAFIACLTMCGGAPVRAQTATSALPAPLEAAITRSRLPREAFALLVADADGPVSASPRLAYRAQAEMNPASVMKLVTTFAALDLLGPAYQWTTQIALDGRVEAGVLKGNLVIQGGGDPKLVVERLWLLLARVRSLGVRQVTGDIVLDASAFEPLPTRPGDFDDQPLRAYNAAPDALLINFKAVVLTFSPDAAAGVARVHLDPPLADVQRPSEVPLAPAGSDCGDWRASLRADFSDPTRIRLGGTYPVVCGEKLWALAYADPSSHARRAVEGMWREMGGQVAGQVRARRPDERAPAGAPVLSFASPPLAELVRDINKFSNNVMAQQVFLTLSPNRPASFAQARARLGLWWTERLPGFKAPVLENGSGLSRDERITAQSLAGLLRLAWQSALMPDFAASLPLAGVDGTLRRSNARAAHLKTGSLRDVAAIAGYVDAAQGQRRIVVGLVNHPNAAAGRQVLDALALWASEAGTGAQP